MPTNIPPLASPGYPPAISVSDTDKHVQGRFAVMAEFASERTDYLRNHAEERGKLAVVGPSVTIPAPTSSGVRSRSYFIKSGAGPTPYNVIVLGTPTDGDTLTIHFSGNRPAFMTGATFSPGNSGGPALASGEYTWGYRSGSVAWTIINSRPTGQVSGIPQYQNYILQAGSGVFPGVATIMDFPPLTQVPVGGDLITLQLSGVTQRAHAPLVIAYREPVEYTVEILGGGIPVAIQTAVANREEGYGPLSNTVPFAFWSVSALIGYQIPAIPASDYSARVRCFVQQPDLNNFRGCNLGALFEHRRVSY